IVIEPLARYNPQGELFAVLAEEVPTLENGGFAADLMSITWKLKEGLLWSDGTPVTSADLVFTYEFCVNPDTGCASNDLFAGISSIEAIDDSTIKINFAEPTPFPYKPFVSYNAPIIQAAQWADCMGANAIGCTEQSFKPIGTGPYMVTEFLPNDSVLYDANPNYRDPNKPYFASVFIKGGGDAEAAARAVLETGESDYSWNLQVAPEVLNQMQLSGQGSVQSARATSLERIVINFTNPDPALGDDRAEYLDGNNPHPFLSDIAVRKALSMAIDRTTLTNFGYAGSGQPTCNFIPGPPAFVSTANDPCTQDIEGANALLDEAGIVDTDGDGIREKDGVPLRIVYQTSTNAVRQGYQAFIKQWWAEIGVETELRNIDAAVYFGGDVASPDTFTKFYTDVEMYTNGATGQDFASLLANYTCENINGVANNWFGGNVPRYCNPEYDDLLAQLNAEGDPTARQELVKALNDHLVQNYVLLPLTYRGSVSGFSNRVLGGRINPWDAELWNIADWTESSG
ncbi:MAG: peptide ABC transporter substrate-binding protein, partial [Anaerolineales bacterium]|nr:peptide ABC transporter substrate-binding protein [Anaerolineales bacterium]